MKNSAAFLDIAFAASHIGAIFLPINFRLASDEIAYIVENAGARVLIADEEFGQQRGRTRTHRPGQRGAQADATRLAANAAPTAAHPRLPSDLMRLMYTSGTTDRPKGVMLTYENFYWKSADQVLVLGLSRDTRLLVAGPLYHVGALDLPGIAVLWQGGMLSIQRDFDAAQCLAAIEADRLNAAWLAPVMTTSILTYPDRERYDVSSLRWAIGGGEKTPEARIRAFSHIFHQCPLHRRLRTDRNRRRRYLHGARPRDRKDRIDWPPGRPCRDRDPRRCRQSRRARRRMAKSVCAAQRSRADTGRIPGRPRPRSSANGSAAATSATSTTTAFSISPTARRT